MDSALHIVGIVATAAGAIAIPMGLTVGVVELLRRTAPDEFYALPVLKRGAALGGLALAAALIVLDPGLAAFSAGRLFAADGPWSGGFLAVVGARLFAPSYGLGDLIDQAIWGDNRLFQGLAAAAVVLLAVALVLPFRIWPRATATLVCACVLALAAWVCFLTVYVAAVAGWSLHGLNFWAFAVIGLLYQRYRNRAQVPA